MSGFGMFNILWHVFYKCTHVNPTEWFHCGYDMGRRQKHTIIDKRKKHRKHNKTLSSQMPPIGAAKTVGYSQR